MQSISAASGAGGHRPCVTVEDRSGSIKQVADLVWKHEFRLQSILTSYANVEVGFRTLVLRTKGNGAYDALLHDLEGSYPNLQVNKG